MRNFCRMIKSFFGPRWVKQIPLKIGNMRIADDVRLQILRSKFDGGAKIGAHAALSIGSDKDQATAGWCAATPLRNDFMHFSTPFSGGRRGCKVDTLGMHVMTKNSAELISLDLAHISRFA